MNRISILLLLLFLSSCGIDEEPFQSDVVVFFNQDVVEEGKTFGVTFTFDQPNTTGQTINIEYELTGTDSNRLRLSPSTVEIIDGRRFATIFCEMPADEVEQGDRVITFTALNTGLPSSVTVGDESSASITIVEP